MDIFLSLQPLQEPLYIFSTLIALIFVSPFIFRLIKIPDIAAFIIMGILVGPHGLNILNIDSSIELLGTVGLIYIMFVVGLELDLGKLKLTWRNSLIFGLLTFSIPFILGMIISLYIIQVDIKASIIISIMLATHTLVAYPIARKSGVHHNLSVLTAIGGTIITDTLVLIILSVITETLSDKPVILQITRLFIAFGIYLFTIFYGYPIIARWFFKYIKRDRPVHFLFLMLMVSMSAVLAKLIGFEPIIGAFVAGLALNHNIPKNSLLMHHVDFVGNFLFIPVFLIGIGMLINLKILILGPYIWYISSIFIIAAIFGKWIAAYAAGKILGFNNNQKKLLFALTSSRAAATIAVMLIGFHKHIISEPIFNSTIFIILVTSIVASVLTEKYSKRIVLAGDVEQNQTAIERILVPVANTQTMENLVELAYNFQKKNSMEPIYILNIINDNQGSKENVIKIRKELEENVSEFNNLNEMMKVITRVDLNTASGIVRAAKEYMITDIVFGWGGKTNTSQKIFGNIFDHLLINDQTLYCCKIFEPLKKIKSLYIILPLLIEKDPQFSNFMDKLFSLPLAENYDITIIPKFGQTAQNLKTHITKTSKNIKFLNLGDDQLIDFPQKSHYLTILFQFRKESVAFHATQNNLVNSFFSKSSDQNLILIVPGSPII